MDKPDFCPLPPGPNLDPLRFVIAGMEEAVKIICRQNPKKNLLHLAAQYGCLNLIQAYIKNMDVNEVDLENMEGKTPLHYAIEYNQPAAVKFLLEYGADIKATDFFVLAPAHYAVKYAVDDKIINLLMDRQINWAIADEDGVTPLMMAASPEIAQLILDQDPERVSDKDNEGNNVLHHAAANLLPGMVEFWIKEGIDWQTSNLLGQCPWQHLETHVCSFRKVGNDILETEQKISEIKKFLAPCQD